MDTKKGYDPRQMVSIYPRQKFTVRNTKPCSQQVPLLTKKNSLSVLLLTF